MLAKYLLVAGLILIAFGLAYGATWYVYHPSLWPEGGVSAASIPASAKLLEILFRTYEAIFVGLVVGVLGVAVPQAYRRAQERFEREREARRLFSSVDTGVQYLPDRIAAMANVEEALKHLEALHVQKHELLAFDYEFKRELAQFVADGGIEAWSARTYLRLMATRIELGTLPEKWWTEQPNERRSHFIDARSVADALMEAVGKDLEGVCDHLNKKGDQFPHFQARLNSTRSSVRKQGKNWKSNKSKDRELRNRVDIIWKSYESAVDQHPVWSKN